MDVRCEKCSTVYDFDEARIPVAGLPVKCSTCQHVFRVYRTTAPASGDEQWMLKQVSGNVVRFKEMTTLQRWIVERKVTPNDEISKTGHTWRRLGDISELAPFFVAVDQPPMPPTPLVPSPLAGAGARWEGQPQSFAHAPPTGNWQMGAAPAAAAPVGPTRMHGTGPHPALEPDDDTDSDFTPNGGKMKWVLFVLVILLGAGAGVYALRPDLVQRFIGPGVSELALSQVDTGYTELARDTYAAIERAKESFQQALTLAPNYAEARAGLAQAELNRAEYLAEEAAELEKKGAPATELTQRRAHAAELAEQAHSLAKQALAADPASLGAQRVLADYQRFMGAPEAGKAMLDKARAAAPREPWIAYVLGATVAPDEALAERAIRYFDETLELAPKHHRARYKLAKVFLAQGNTAKALTHTEMILKDEPEHERAKALMNILRPPAPTPAPEPAPAAPKQLSVEQLIAQADRLRRGDNAERALSLYEKAVDMEPEDPDAHTGMGWCYVDLEEPDAAIESFKEALGIAPRFTDAHIGLAESYRMKGMKRDAVKHYRQYLDILPDGPEAAVAKRMIEQLSQ